MRAMKSLTCHIIMPIPILSCWGKTGTDLKCFVRFYGCVVSDFFCAVADIISWSGASRHTTDIFGWTHANHLADYSLSWISHQALGDNGRPALLPGVKGSNYGRCSKLQKIILESWQDFWYVFHLPWFIATPFVHFLLLNTQQFLTPMSRICTAIVVGNLKIIKEASIVSRTL